MPSYRGRSRIPTSIWWVLKTHYEGCVNSLPSREQRGRQCNREAAQGPQKPGSAWPHAPVTSLRRPLPALSVGSIVIGPRNLEERAVGDDPSVGSLNRQRGRAAPARRL